MTEKPVRITDNERIRGFNEKVRNGLEHALNVILGTEQSKLRISQFEPFLMPVEAYVTAYKKEAIMIKLLSDQDYQGELYWFFERKTAIILSSLMRMLSPVALKEKLDAGQLDANDEDAFGEIGNQLSGILDRAFRTLTKKNIHLKMDFKKTFYPEEKMSPEQFLRHEEYVVLLTTLTVPEHGNQKLTLLLPRSLYEVMLNLEIELEGIRPKLVLAYSWDEARTELLRTRLNSRYTKVMPVADPNEVITWADRPDITAVGIDLPPMDFPLEHQHVILLKRLASNRGLLRLPYLLTWDGADEAQVKEVKSLGVLGASTGPFTEAFLPWASALLKDPSRST